MELKTDRRVVVGHDPRPPENPEDFAVADHAAAVRNYITCFRRLSSGAVMSQAFMSASGRSLPNRAIRNMSVRHPIADMRADIAGRRLGPISDIAERFKST